MTSAARDQTSASTDTKLRYREELRAYFRPSADPALRVISDALVCAVLIAICLPLGWVPNWARPYIGAVLIMWVLSDFASNLLALGSQKSIAHIERGDSMARVLMIQNAALATICIPLGIVATWIIQIIQGVFGYRSILAAVACVGAALPWFAAGDVVSALATRRGQDLRAILKRRRVQRSEVSAGVVYFMTMFVIGPIAAIPVAILFRVSLDDNGRHALVPALWALLYALVVWLIGIYLGARLATSRRERIVEVLKA